MDHWNFNNSAVMSRDGSYVTGQVFSPSEEKARAFLWRKGEGIHLYNGIDDNWPYPLVVANTGRILGTSGRNGVATYWDPDTDYQPRLLTDLLSNYGYEMDTVTTLWCPKAITPDGLIMVGTAVVDEETKLYKIVLSD